MSYTGLERAVALPRNENAFIFPMRQEKAGGLYPTIHIILWGFTKDVQQRSCR